MRTVLPAARDVLENAERISLSERDSERVLARLAVSLPLQGQGLGGDLLLAAGARALAVSGMSP